MIERVMAMSFLLPAAPLVDFVLSTSVLVLAAPLAALIAWGLAETLRLYVKRRRP
jgi:hypothetical protein